MRKFLIPFLFVPLHVFAQFSDDFSDGNFSQNPSWIGDQTDFEVNTDGQLHLNANAAGQSYLSTPCYATGPVSWEFYVQLDFNPSYSNYAKVYLQADQADLSGPLNGYYLRIGGSSDDKLSLYRQDGTINHPMIHSANDLLDKSPLHLRIRVSRNSGGLWELHADTSGGAQYSLIGMVYDSKYLVPLHFGLSCHYTSTRSDKFYFDDFLVTGATFTDTLAPVLESVIATDAYHLRLGFSETIERNAAEDILHYSLDQGMGSPIAAAQDALDSRFVELRFSTPFSSGSTYALHTSGLRDFFGNSLSNPQVSFAFYQAQAFDIVFNELMADPSPAVALPDREYIELYNSTSFPIYLGNWSLRIGTYRERLPNTIILPDSFLVLVASEGLTDFPPGLPLAGMPFSPGFLSNTGNTLELRNTAGALISSLLYSDAWYQEPGKETGGWALEQIDPTNICGVADNWKASVNSQGGTPGRRNSVYGLNPDTISPRLIHISIPNDRSLLLEFSESLDSLTLADANAWWLDQGLQLTQQNPVAPLFRQVVLHLASPLQEKTHYQLALSDLLQDCAGNSIESDTVLFALPEPPEASDLLINEILFDPLPDGVDFVELYNTSDKALDLSLLRLGNLDAGSISHIEPITDQHYLFPPKSYRVFTTDIAAVKAQYPTKDAKAFFQVADLPSMGDTGGSIAVATASLEVLDAFSYTDDLHFALLNEKEGVSLERVHFDMPTQQRTIGIRRHSKTVLLRRAIRTLNTFITRQTVVRFK